MVPLPYAAAASRLAGLLDVSSAARIDPVPLGMRALLSALAPYAATTKLFVVDSATASRAAAASRAALVGDQRDLLSHVTPRLSASVVALDPSSTTTLVDASGDPSSTTTRVDASGTGARGAPSGIGGLRGFLVDAAVAGSHLLNTASGTGARGALSGIVGLRGFVVDAAADGSHLLNTLIGAASGIRAPRYFLSTAAAAAACFHPCTTLLVLDAATASQLETASIALATPIAATGSHIFNSSGGLHLPRTAVSRNNFASLHQFLLTRATSTTTTLDHQVQAGARIRRPKVRSTMKRATRMRQVVKSIDSQLSHGSLLKEKLG